MRWLIAFLLLPLPALADEEVTICYNWGCGAEARVVFQYTDLDRIGELFAGVETPEVERGSIRLAIGLMERIAGEQTPTRNDRGGNVDDDGVEGRMDCIDHSHNSTVYLRLLERRGLLRFHRVLDPIDRAPWILDAHWAARIEQQDSGEQFIVDSWFFDNGEPAVIFTLRDWKRGAEPHG
jgi:hypothetical protein